MDQDAVFVELRNIADQAIRTVMPIWMPFAYVLDSSPHLPATMLHKLITSANVK